jgi:hypothetical protein
MQEPLHDGTPWADRERRMRRLHWAAIALLVTVCATPARASSLTPEETQWALRARAVWRAYSYGSEAEQQGAERGAVANGRRAAMAGLRRLLKALSPSDPLRFAVAYTMALLGLGYQEGRDALLEYARVTAKGTTLYASIVGKAIDPEAPEGEQGLFAGGLPGYLYAVYKRRQDPVLLSALLDLTQHEDGAGADLLCGIIHELAGDHPRELLVGLRAKPKGVWQRTANALALESQRGPRDTFLAVEKAYPKLSRIAKSQHDSLRETARRLVDDVRAEQREQGGEGRAERAD